MGSTDLNLLLDVGFNREVAEDAALYWTKETGNLAELIEKADLLDPSVCAALGARAKQRIADAYSWRYIADRYEEVFCADIYERAAE